VIVEVFRTQRQAVDALPRQLPDAGVDAAGVAVIAEAAGERARDACFLLAAMQQQSAGVGSDRAAVEAGDELAAGLAGEAETRLGTLCPSEGRWLLVETC